MFDDGNQSEDQVHQREQSDGRYQADSGRAVGQAFLGLGQEQKDVALPVSDFFHAVCTLPVAVGCLQNDLHLL